MYRRAVDRFLAMTVLTESGCLEWTGVLRGGYGRFRDETGALVTAHRWIYERTHGPLGPDTVDHLCRNKACQRPGHMQRVALEENIARRDDAAKGDRDQCPKGHSDWRVDHPAGRAPRRQCAECNRRRKVLPATC